MSANASQLNYILQKLYEKQKVLGGGKDGGKGQVKETDKFKEVKQQVQEGIHYIRKKQQERDEKLAKNGGSTAETIRMAGEIKDKIKEVEKQIGQMNEELRKQQKEKKKYPQAELDAKEKLYANCREQLGNLQMIEKGTADKAAQNIKTLTELRSDLLTSDNAAEIQAQQRQVDSQLSAEHEAALENFKKKDAELDAVISQIDEGLGNLKDKALVMGEQIDKQGILIKNLEDEVDKTNEQLVTANEKLKKILVQYRAPSKFCMDIILICILLGLGGVMYNMFTS